MEKNYGTCKKCFVLKNANRKILILKDKGHSIHTPAKIVRKSLLLGIKELYFVLESAPEEPEKNT